MILVAWGWCTGTTQRDGTGREEGREGRDGEHVYTCGGFMLMDFPGGSDGKASAYNVRDLGSIPGLGRFPGEGNGNPLQYSCLENPMDRGAWCRLLSMGSQRVGHDQATSFSL